MIFRWSFLFLTQLTPISQLAIMFALRSYTNEQTFGFRKLLYRYVFPWRLDGLDEHLSSACYYQSCQVIQHAISSSTH
jgi:hypothetical protein